MKLLSFVTGVALSMVAIHLELSMLMAYLG
jgi:hypothetical protein